MVARRIVEKEARKRDRSPFKPGLVGHGAEFGFILRTERNSKQFISAHT